MHGRRAGTLRENRGRAMFAYRYDYRALPGAVPLSLSAPLSNETYNLTHWLDGLLPDNAEVRRRWAVQHRAASTQPMHLLASPLGLDCAGAVQFCEPDALAEALGRASGVHTLTEADVADIIRRLSADRSAWSAPRAVASFSLAGAQSKIALHLHRGVWGIPYGDTPTSHIVKPAVFGFLDQDVIEHLSQRAATLLGLPAAATECLEIDGERALLIERYDREPSQSGSLLRIHQEDMCQALGVRPDVKYQADGGPGVAKIAQAIERHSVRPDLDLRLFRDALIYNWLIAGCDAHAKNYGMLLTATGARMAPLYDLCSFLPYRRRSGTTDERAVHQLPLSMKIGRDYSLLAADHVQAWERTARTLLLPTDETVDRAVELAERLPSALTEAVSELPAHLAASPQVEILQTEIAQRTAHCRRLPSMARPTSQRESGTRWA